MRRPYHSKGEISVRKEGEWSRETIPIPPRSSATSIVLPIYNNRRNSEAQHHHLKASLKVTARKRRAAEMSIVETVAQKHKTRRLEEKRTRKKNTNVPPTPQAGRRSKTIPIANKKNSHQTSRKMPVGPGPRAGASKDTPMIILDDEDGDREGSQQQSAFLRNISTKPPPKSSFGSIYTPLPTAPVPATYPARNNGPAPRLQLKPPKLAYDSRMRAMSIYAE
jgi:hypothetical protein